MSLGVFEKDANQRTEQLQLNCSDIPYPAFAHTFVWECKVMKKKTCILS